ncbi:unnamed protein product [Leptidea sinapis]|uniref:Uncharacterized protein n=1 Tax=Leptidea sinapis TaxID=189913 RepID=A0A5E4QAC6_9NEOP|nr:unnamed protein product [Leptidea sinapis]
MASDTLTSGLHITTSIQMYWLNHNLIRVRPLVPLLREIKSFLDSTKEYSLMLTIFPWASTSTTVHQSDRFMQVF